jgi:hypothetical protein
MGSVWAATDEATAADVALKLILRPEIDLRRRLQREARALSALRHKNIVDVVDSGETEAGDPFLVMPLLIGETLAELLADKRRLDSPEAARIGRDVAGALEAAHAVQIVHRDLKPANIFLHRASGEGAAVVKVLDFGVAKNLGVYDGLRTAFGGQIGTPPYMSPEQVRAAPDVDHRADIWSLGVVMFEMLTGVRPFDGEASELHAKIAEGDIPTIDRYVRRTDPALAQLVARCMRRNRDERFQSAAELAAALERFVNEDPGTERLLSSPTSWEQAPSPSNGPELPVALLPAAPLPPVGSEVESDASKTLLLAPEAVPAAVQVAVQETASPWRAESATQPPRVTTVGAALMEERRRMRIIAAVGGAAFSLAIAASMLVALLGQEQPVATLELSAAPALMPVAEPPKPEPVQPPPEPSDPGPSALAVATASAQATVPPPQPAAGQASPVIMREFPKDPPAATTLQPPPPKPAQNPCAGKTGFLRTKCLRDHKKR